MPTRAAKKKALAGERNISVPAVPKRKLRRLRRPMSEIVAAIDPAAYRRHFDILRDPPVGKEFW